MDIVPIEPSWVSVVKSTADRLEGELSRISDHTTADFNTVRLSVERARSFASLTGGEEQSKRPGFGRRFWSWWTGNEVDQAWSALHMAAEALLSIQSQAVVKAQMGDMAATLVTTLSKGDLRVKDYMATVQLVARPDREITEADRAQLRSIRQACDNSSDGGHADARAYRNTLILVGASLTVVLVGLALLAAFDSSFRSVFSPAHATVGGWYVFELEMVASVAGLTSAILSLKSYTGFQYTYGLPMVQAFLKGSTGAATGIFGVLLVQSGLISSVSPQTNGAVFAVAIIFGYAQYIFTRLVDQKAKDVLGSATSRNDPGVTPQVATGTETPDLLTTKEDT